jgi:hypothetical protein
LLLFLNKQKYKSENKHKIKRENTLKKIIIIKACFTMYVFIGDFSTNFHHKISKKKKKGLLCGFVCPSWFKEIGGLHSVQRSWAPTSPLY